MPSIITRYENNVVAHKTHTEDQWFSAQRQDKVRYFSPIEGNLLTRSWLRKGGAAESAHLDTLFTMSEVVIGFWDCNIT
jgi:hypothetical protein